MPLTILSGFLTIISYFTAGLAEELIWRGYVIPRLIESYHSVNVGVLIWSITWAFYHIDPFHIGITLLLGIVYGYSFIKIRRLTPLIYGHILFDVISFILPQTLTLLV